MKKILLIACSLLSGIHSWTQGCVAIRNVTGISPDLLFKNIPSTGKWVFNVTNRYYSASSTFIGDKFITDTLVTNHIYSLNFSALKKLSNGWSLGVNIPVSANSRKNNRDHGGPLTPKHTTRSFGLGDVRVSVYKWLLDPARSTKGNIQAGLGLKFPTGDYKYQDYFFRNDSTKVLAPVDQAIQLGDGGTGITTELSAFYSINRTITLFVYGFYLINPREQNGVSNLKGRNPSPVEIRNSITEMSVPDQYSIRGGANLQIRKVVFTAGLRYEKVPIKDLIGGNKGFRRAASITSVEPGVTYKIKNSLVFTHLTVPFKRNMIQSIPNIISPAGFADILISAGIQFQL